MKTKHWYRTCLLYVICLPVLTAGCKSDKKPAEENPPGDSPRIVAYLLGHDRQWPAALDTLNWDGVTDLNLAFVVPETDGTFVTDAAYSSAVQKAHARGVKIFFSIGGGDPPPYLADLIRPPLRDVFAASIAAFAENYQFDGVDIDLENALINEHYAPFVAEVKKAMQAKGRKVTAALASWNGNLVHDSTLAKFDAIHIMSYDQTGPWNPGNPGPHSPYSMAVDDFNYFSVTRNQPPEKLSVGLPFYGYGFGAGAPESITFRNIAAAYPQHVNNDEITVTGGGKIYYNGKQTIRDKVRFAKGRNAFGVMFWQLSGDAGSPHSLLDVIRNELEK